MNKKLLSITILCLLGLTACGAQGGDSPADTSSQPESSQTSSINWDDYQNCTVSITNKAALQEAWHAGQGGRALELELNPNANLNQYIKDGIIRIESSNDKVLVVTGKIVKPVGAGTATVTVKYGKDGSDSVEITVLDPISEPAMQERTIKSLLEDWAKPDFVEYQYKYHITAKISGWKDASTTDGTKYGNFYVQDLEDSSKTIYVYGCSATMTFEFGATGLYSYNQANQDWLTHDKTKDAMIGATVELEAVAYSYGTTKELTAKLVNLQNPQIVPATGVTIDQDDFELATRSSTKLTLTVTPEDCNQSASFTSDHPEIASVNAQGLVVGLTPGEAVITATVGEFSDTVKVTVYQGRDFVVQEAPEAGKAYKLGLFQENLGKQLFATGVESGNYAGTSSDADDSANFELVATEGGYHVKVTRRDETVKYLNVTTSNNGKTGSDAKAYNNPKFQDTPSTVWVINEDVKTIVTTVSAHEGDYAFGNGTYFLGTSNTGTYNTLGLVSVTKASSNFVAQLLLEAVFEPTTSPVVGKKYTYGLWQGNLAKMIYSTGLEREGGNYGASTESLDSAAEAELVTTEGGYFVKFTTKDETPVVKYLGASPRTYKDKDNKDKYTVDCKFVDEPSTVFTWNSSLNTVQVKVNETGTLAGCNGDYYLGTYNTYDTFSFSKTSYASTSFVGQFYSTEYVARMAAPHATAIALDKTEISLSAGTTARLTATLTPANSKDEILWKTDDAAVATVENGVVTGVAIGVTKVTAYVNDTVKAECTVTVTKALVYTELEKFDFASTLTVYKAYNKDDMDAFIKGSSNLGAETNYVSHDKTGTGTDPLIGANGSWNSTAWSNYNLLKLGSGSKNCKMKLTFKEGTQIGKIVIKAAGWNGKTNKLSVNGGEQVTIAAAPTAASMTDETAFKEYTFTFAATNEITFETALCVMISEMVVYTVE